MPHGDLVRRLRTAEGQRKRAERLKARSRVGTPAGSRPVSPGSRPCTAPKGVLALPLGSRPGTASGVKPCIPARPSTPAGALDSRPGTAQKDPQAPEDIPSLFFI